MYIEEERTVGPLLGADSIKAGIHATIIALFAVIAFMLIFYFFSGLIADISLVYNLLMITGIMGFLNVMMPGAQATLTLPGIAGIILTLGMAVDANVLINERIREEIANGRPLQAAVSNGFNKAFTAIFDTHVTTLISAFMLFQFGSGPIKGFAITLSIGTLASLFTSVFVSHVLFDISMQTHIIKSLKSLKFFHNTKIDFIAMRYFCFALSLTVTVVGMYFFWAKRHTAYGVDFSGGQIQQYKFTRAIDAQSLRKALDEGGVKNFVIQQFEKNPETVIIRSPEDSYDKTVQVLKAKFSDNQFQVMRLEKVGPVVGQALRHKALLAILFALGGILIFIAFRFKHFDFAVAGVIALLHDILVAIGALMITNRQIDLLVITALLTIAGYSINDTIVVYDRVRENLLKVRKMSFREILNLSVNETLSRTINTTATALLVVLVLYLFGGEVLNTFAFTLLVGFTTGVYSTVFVASPLVLLWQKFQGRK
ncbi:MAG: protein translocase subunit SecF [Candidatus Omnitrophica bacterium]|nr:protein translocase subunit SecF [Candidatus Omnitrophota bacterium]